jgi:hypothetical protein
MSNIDDTTVIPPLPEEAAEERPSGGKHPINVGHLVMGLAFAGLLVIWALYVTETVPQDDLRWLLPVPWLVGGGAGLIASLAAQRKRW